MTEIIEKHRYAFEKLFLIGSITLDEVIENIWKRTSNSSINPQFKQTMSEIFISSLPEKIGKDVIYNPKTQIFTIIKGKLI